MASADSIAGRGNSPKRWVVETRKTPGMLAKAEKQAVSETDRDRAVTERVLELTSSGPFDSVIHVDGGDVPAEGTSFAAACDVIGQAGIDRQHQTRLVVLDSRWFSLFNGDGTVTREAIAAAMGRGSSPMSVQWASSAVFAVANRATHAQARGLSDVEYATLEWVDWYNHRRLHGQLTGTPRHTTPAAHEHDHYSQTRTAAEADTHNKQSLPNPA